MKTAITRKTLTALDALDLVRRRLSELEDTANRVAWIVILDGGAIAGGFTDAKSARQAAEALLPEACRFEWLDLSTHSKKRYALFVRHGADGGVPANINVEEVPLQGPVRTAEPDPARV